MRQFILSLLACLCLTAYSQTTSQADLLVEEAQKLESKQDYPTAITKLKQADELYVKTGKTQSAERATCLHILGRCYLNLERPEGLTYTQMAADMRKTILGETNIKYISSLNNTGLYYLTVAKDYPKAAEIHGKTWELCSRIQPRPEQAFMFHINLARCYIALGEMDKASAIVEEEIAISKKMYGEKSLSVARQLQQIGSLYYLSGRKDVGVTYYEQAFNIFPDDSKEYEQLLDWISSIYVELNNQPKVLEYMKLVEAHKEAAANYQQAADIYKILPGSDVKYQDALSSLNRCHTMMGNETAARQTEQDAERQRMAVLNRLLKENLEQLDAYRLQWGEDGLMYVSALGTIADIYYTQGQTDKALAYMEPFLSGETTALRNLFRLSKADERLAFWKDIRSSLDSIPLRAANIAATGTPEQKQRFARLGYDALLFSKGIMLNSSIELESLIRASGDKSLLGQYNKATLMAEQILSMQSELPNATNQTEARKNIIRQKEEYEQLQLDLMRKSTDFGDYTRYLSVKWQDVQKHLHGNSIAIEFALIDDELLAPDKHLAAFVLRPGDTSPTAIKLMSQKLLSKEMQSPTAFTTTENGAHFWKALDEYISKADTIYFSPDGILHQLPVEYLPYGAGNLPLAFQKAVYRLSSTKEIALDKASLNYSSAALFGGLDYEMASTKVRNIVSTDHNSGKFRNGQNGYHELPYTLNEVNNVNSLLKEKKIKTNLFVGENGTEKQFRALDGKAVSLIHIATHGDYKELKQREADDAMKHCFLIMSGANATEENNDGLLRADEISTLNLRGCRMVVLSACNTGQGTLGADGLFGLQRGFKNAGVQTILMTLSAVDDQASMLLMTKFYENIISGLSERQALIKAQQYLRENGYADSKYWAPFILLDAGRSPIPHPSKS